MSNLEIQYVSPDRLRPYPGNARSHSRKQLKLIEKSIMRFGFTNPILVTDDFEVVAGHGRLQAAKSLGHAARAGRRAEFAFGGRQKGPHHCRQPDRRAVGLGPRHSRDRIQGCSRSCSSRTSRSPAFRWARSIRSWTRRPKRQPNEPGPEDHVPPVVAAPVCRKGDLWMSRLASPPVRGRPIQ